MRLTKLIVPILILVVGCKVTKVADSNISSQDTFITVDSTTIEEVVEYWITQKNDTLYDLDQEVEGDIYRLLPDTFSIIAVGDIMNGTNFPNASYLPPEKGTQLWNSSCDLLRSADVTFGNLEGTILDGDGDPKKCSNPKYCYLFKMPSFMVSNFKNCGFDLLSTANNHANDFGEVGRKATAKTLDSVDIAHAGSLENHYTIIRRNHLKIGLIAFAPNKGTLTFYDESRAEALIKKIDSITDITIVSIHGGAEGAKNQHVTDQREFYFGEDRGNIYQFSRIAIDAGADVILGHGPHVPRGIETYKKRIIAYSMGNFLTYGRFNLKNENALAPLFSLKVNAEGEFLTGEIISYRQSYTLGPLQDPKNRAALKIKKLSEEDFPESSLYIDEEGNISYIQN